APATHRRDGEKDSGSAPFGGAIPLPCAPADPGRRSGGWSRATNSRFTEAPCAFPDVARIGKPLHVFGASAHAVETGYDGDHAHLAFRGRPRTSPASTEVTGLVSAVRQGRRRFDPPQARAVNACRLRSRCPARPRRPPTRCPRSTPLPLRSGRTPA